MTGTRSYWMLANSPESGKWEGRIHIHFSVIHYCAGWFGFLQSSGSVSVRSWWCLTAPHSPSRYVFVFWRAGMSDYGRDLLSVFRGPGGVVEALWISGNSDGSIEPSTPCVHRVTVVCWFLVVVLTLGTAFFWLVLFILTSSDPRLLPVVVVLSDWPCRIDWLSDLCATVPEGWGVLEILRRRSPVARNQVVRRLT